LIYIVGALQSQQARSDAIAPNNAARNSP